MGIKHIIAVDPGDVRNGFCYFKYNTETKMADVRIMDIFTSKQLTENLLTIWGIGQPREGGKKPDLTFVVENFRVDSKVRGKAFQWNEVLTARNIGKVEMLADWLGAPLVIQEPANVLGMGRKIVSGIIKVSSGHLRDDHSAFIHGVHYMLNARLINTTDQITMFGQGAL